MAEISTPVTTPTLQSPALFYSVLPKTSLYVGDLHPQVTELDLFQTFGRFGQLFSVRVCRARASFKSLGYGFVNFWNSSAAAKALASLNHTELKGKTMRIMWCERDPIRRKNGTANLYVKNLDSSVSSSQLEEMFGKYGTILSCKVAEKYGKSEGFGFVQFESEDSAKAAVGVLNGIMLEGKKLYVGKFLKKSERNKTSLESFTNLYVNNLDKDISEGILKEKFSVYGRVSNVVIIKDGEGISRGFGFVKFDSEVEAMKAIGCMNGALLGSRKVFVARAQKKEDRPKSVKPANEIAPYDRIYYKTIYKPYNVYVNPDVYKNFSKRIVTYCELKNHPKNFSSSQDRRSAYAFFHDQTSCAWKQSSRESAYVSCAGMASSNENVLRGLINELQQPYSASLAVVHSEKGKQVLEGR